MRISNIIFYMIIVCPAPWAAYAMNDEIKELRGRYSCSFNGCKDTFSHEYSYYAHLADKHGFCLKCEKYFSEIAYTEHANDCGKMIESGPRKWLYKRSWKVDQQKEKGVRKRKKKKCPITNYINEKQTIPDQTTSSTTELLFNIPNIPQHVPEGEAFDLEPFLKNIDYDYDYGTEIR